jgi:LmbE family N-acetylglucosaminyl deacetylase
MGKNKVLVVAAHPDDEILGLGGKLIQHVKEGDEVYCLILAEGVTSRGSGREEVEKLRDQCREAGKIIGFKEIFFSNFPDNKMDSVPLLDVVKDVEKHLNTVKPSIIYTHHKGDLNIDHRTAYNAVITACRPCNKLCPREIYTFESLSSTEWQVDDAKAFIPNVYMNIENEIEDKIKAMKVYKSEIRQHPHSRSEKGIRVLAEYRGLQAGLKFAEAFRLERKIE